MSKPVPDVTALNREYFEGCAAGELRVRHCPKCDAVFRFSYTWCPECWSPEIDYRVASGKATVTHFSVVHRAPYEAFDEEVPYVVALVDLEEGVRMMCNVIGCAPDSVHIGMKVKVCFEQRGDVTIPQFTPED